MRQPLLNRTIGIVAASALVVSASAMAIAANGTATAAPSAGVPGLVLTGPAQARVGQVVHLALESRAGAALGAFQTTLRYDDRAVEIQRVRTASHLSGDGATLTPLSAVETPNRTLIAGWTCSGTGCGALPPASHRGSIVLASIDVLVKQSGRIALAADDTELDGADGQVLARPQPVTHTLSVPGSAYHWNPMHATATAAHSAARSYAPAALDQDHDGTVTASDVTALTASWVRAAESDQACPVPAPGTDVNGDGCFTIADLQSVAAKVSAGRSSERTIATVRSAGVRTFAAPITTFTVNSVNDGSDAAPDGICQTTTPGECTLRAALQEANRASGAVAIAFNIAGAGVHTIAPATVLPSLNNPSGIAIDGFTQPGSSANTDPLADNAIYGIELKGQGPHGIDGFFVGTSNNVIRGLDMHGFQRAIWIYGFSANANVVEGDMLGLLPNGTYDPTQALYGPSNCVVMQQGASNNHIGVPGDANRNVVSGCNHIGISTYNIGTNNNYIQNNIVGLDPTGTQRRGTVSHGIDINTGTQGTIIGGTGFEERNVSSGNFQEGVEISHNPFTLYNKVIGNYIGTDLTGNAAPAYAQDGQWGVHLEGYPNCGTGTCPLDAGNNTVTNNVIVNTGHGGIMVDKGVHDSVIANNRIGVTLDGTPAGNALFGINVNAGSVRITIGPGNEIANNDNGIQIEADGVEPPDPTETITNQITITQNSIHDNGTGGIAALGIDLAPFGVTNTAGNSDALVNDAMLAPTLSNAQPAYVDATTCAGCTVELFVADRGAGQTGSGKTFLTSAVADASGVVRVFVPAAGQGQVVTATATSPTGSTSEFSKNVAIPNPRPNNQPPVPTFTVTCAHVTCAFDATASHDPDGSIINYAWTFGDGATATGVTVSHAYATGGAFTAALTVTDNDAATGTLSKTANPVNQNPVAGFSANCTFQLCSFDGSGSSDPDGAVASYSWDFGDGTTASGATTSHTYAASGAYTVVLTVGDGTGGTGTVSHAFAVTALPAGTVAFDTFTRTAANGWGSADVGGAWTTNNPAADNAVNGSNGRIAITTATSSHLGYLAGVSVRDSDTTVDVGTDKTPTGGTWGQVAYLTARRVASNDEYRVRLRFPVGGGVKLSFVKVTGTNTEIAIGNEVTVAGLTYVPGQMYSIRFRVTGVNPTTLQAKAWAAGTGQPAAWALTATDMQAELQALGNLGVRAMLGGSASNTPVTWSFDNYDALVINTPPTAAFTPSCTNSVCHFDATPSNDPDGTIASYAWDFGDGTTGTGATPIHDYGQNGFGTHTVTLTVTDNLGATSAVAQPVMVANVPAVATFTASCPGFTCSFDATASHDPDGSIASYAWDFGDGTNATGPTASHTYATADQYTIVLVVTDNSGAVTPTSQTINVLPPNQPPVASFTQTCTLLSCSFDASASHDTDGTIASYSWDFGDGTTASGAAPVHAFPQTGSYPVVLTVTDDRGGNGTASATVAVIGPNVLPHATFTTSCVLLTCTFDGTASHDPDGTIVSYAWDLGGVTASGPTATRSFPVAGTWPVHLTVTDDRGGADTATANAVVAPASQVSQYATDTFTRSVSSGWGTADSGGAWTGTNTNFATNGTVGTQKVTAINGGNNAYLPAPGVTDVDVTTRVAASAVASGTGHWATISVRKVSANFEYRVRVRMSSSGIALAALKLAGSSSSTLLGAEVSSGLAYTPGQFYRVRAEAFGANPTTIRARVWLDGTPEPASWLIVRTDATAGIQAAGQQGLGSFDAASSAPVTFTYDDLVIAPVNAPPTPTFTVACSGYTCNFDGSASTDPDGTITSYDWSFGDGTTATGVTTAHGYSIGGSYTVTLTVTDNSGAKTIVTHTATPNLPPTASFAPSCVGDACSFDASASSDPDGAIASYAWIFGDGATGTGAAASHTYTQSGTYNVTVTVTDAQGATSSTTHGVTVDAPPTAAFTSACTGDACTFDATSSSDADGSIVSYVWTFGDGATATGATASHTYATSGTHAVQLVVTDNAGVTASVTHNAIADQAPTAAFTSSCTDLGCTFDATTSSDPDGSIASYSWDFGDGTITTGVAPAHNYATGGTHTVTLTVTDNLGATGSIAHTVSVNAPPVSAFTPSCTLMGCTFDGSASHDPDGSIVTYAWDFGDGATAGGVTAAHTYTLAGTWPVRLTVTDSSSRAVTVMHTVAVAPTASPTQLATDAFGRTLTGSWGSADLGGAWTTSGVASDFSVTGGVGRFSHPATNTANAARLLGVSQANVDIQTRVSFDQAQTGFGSWINLIGRATSTNNEYRARVRFAAGSVNVEAFKLAGSSSAVAVGSEVVAPGLTSAPGQFYRVRLNLTGTSPTTIRIKVWLDGTAEPVAWNVTVTDSTPSLQAPGAVGLQSWAQASSAFPLTFSFDDLSVRPANLPPVAAFTPSCTGLGCSVDASASSDDGSIASYQWVFGDGSTATGVTAAHSYLTAGTYTITLTVTDDQGVVTVVSQTVAVS